jgi:hypothetical protein
LHNLKIVEAEAVQAEAEAEAVQVVVVFQVVQVVVVCCHRYSQLTPLHI